MTIIWHLFLACWIYLFFLQSYAVAIDFYRVRLYILANLQLIILSSFMTNFQRQSAWPCGRKYRTAIFLFKLTGPFIILVVERKAQLGTKIYVLSWKRYGALLFIMLFSFGHTVYHILWIMIESVPTLIFNSNVYMSLSAMYFGFRNGSLLLLLFIFFVWWISLCQLTMDTMLSLKGRFAHYDVVTKTKLSLPSLPCPVTVQHPVLN